MTHAEQLADYPGYDDYPDYRYELSGEAEHHRDCGTSTESEIHTFWHHLHGPADEVGCPWDVCVNDEDDDYYGPAWRGQCIDSPDYCTGEHPLEEPPF